MPELTNWNFNFDLRDVTAASTKPPIAPEGYYVGKITKTYIDTDYNKDRVNFHMRISEGASTGAFCKETMMLPGTTQRDNRRYWRGLFESMGFQPSQLNGTELNVTDGSSIFIDKRVTFYWKPGNKELGTWNRVLFLSQAAWESEKATFENAVKATTPATPAATATPSAPVSTPQVVQAAAPAPQAGFINNNMSSNDILAMLNTPT
jgi:hypothetical protein